MGLFGENMNWRGKQVNGQSSNGMGIPPIYFLVLLALAAACAFAWWM